MSTPSTTPKPINNKEEFASVYSKLTLSHITKDQPMHPEGQCEASTTATVAQPIFNNVKDQPKNRRGQCVTS
jgi:hypothetical protein